MRSRYEIYVDGIAFSSIHPGIIIQNIGYNTATIMRQTQYVANRNGSIILNNKMEKARVTIQFMLRIYRTQDRQAVLQKIQQWAQGKVLETSDREDQRLYVVCDNFPVIDSVKNWTGTLAVSFTAYEKPFWESRILSTVSLVGDDEEGSLFIPGNAGNTLVSAVVTPSEAITELQITVGDTTIKLEGLNTDAIISIGYDEHGNQYIKAGTTSILAKRTTDSSDDLLAVCGKRNDVAVTADKSVAASIMARGLWL